MDAMFMIVSYNVLRRTQLVRKFPPFIEFEIYYRVHKSPPLVPVFNQMHPAHTLPSYFPRSSLTLSSHLLLCLPSGLFSSDFPIRTLYKFVMSLINTVQLMSIILASVTESACGRTDMFCSLTEFKTRISVPSREART